MTEKKAPATTEGTPTSPNVYDGLAVQARRNEHQGVWEFGIDLSGAFVVIATRKLGGVDDDIREALEPGFKQARADRYNREVHGR